MKKFAFFLLLSAALCQFALADSFYSAFGLGIPQYYVSSQAAGMGGAGIGVAQHLALNSMNPAAVQLRGFTMISASFQGEKVDNKSGDAKVTTRQGNANGFQLAIPMFKDRIALLASLKPLIRSQFAVDFSSDHEDFTIYRTARSNGGLSAASLGLNYALSPKLFIGGLFNFNFGAYNEIWRTDFDNDTYINTKDDITSHLWGTGAELGVLVRPLGFLSIGGMVKLSSTLKIETKTETVSRVELTPVEQTATYPLAFGGGASFEFSKFTFATDFYMQDWSNYRIDDRQSNDLANYLRIGGGIEYVGSKDYLSTYHKSIAFRLGASYAQLPFVDPNGDQATEFFVTAGLGFPFNKNAGRIDLALEVGERSSGHAYPYSESLSRLTASITMAEKWFQRLF
ncbi:hypothetical protein JXA02_08415 [candidate division KSB1 bacterium]|nr:hypothetical protein [candidate division KSB1 bacterium]RQW05426.1 MAG: hypothetical protein EH222_09920 [candidate division KSB1 bacterium]